MTDLTVLETEIRSRYNQTLHDLRMRLHTYLPECLHRPIFAKRDRRYDESFRMVGTHRPKRLAKRRKFSLSQYDLSQSVQSSSFLLCHLPPEIRSRIFQYVYAGTTFHLFLVYQQVKFIKSVLPEPYQYINVCRQLDRWLYHRYSGPSNIMHRKPWKYALTVKRHLNVAANLLSLVLACHQTYQEVLPLLYGTIEFNIDDPSVIVHMAEYFLLPNTLSQIRHLQFRWLLREKTAPGFDISQDPSMWQIWTQCWNILSQRMRLNSIRLEVVYIGSPSEVTLTNPWIRPMLELHGLQTAEVQVRFRESDISWPVFEELSEGLRSSMLSKD